jgi:hypothetical protein
VGISRLINLAGVFLAGARGDRWGHIQTARALQVLGVLGLVAMSVTGYGPLFLIGLAAISGGGGGAMALLPAVVAEAYPPAQRERVLSYATGASSLLGSVGCPPLFGAMLDAGLPNGPMIDLARVTQRLDHVLSSELTSGHFATALALTYRPEDGRITMVNAGHPSPVLCNDRCQLIAEHGCALALGVGATYEANEFILDPGGLLVAYTDGVTEARRHDDLFGETRLLEKVAEMRDDPPRAIVEHVVDAALRHAGGRFSDDVALLVLKRRQKTT